MSCAWAGAMHTGRRAPRVMCVHAILITRQQTDAASPRVPCSGAQDATPQGACCGTPRAVAWTLTNHEGQEFEDPLRGLLAGVAGGRADDLLRHILGHHEQDWQDQVCRGVVPPDGWRPILQWEQPVAASLHGQAKPDQPGVCMNTSSPSPSTIAACQKHLQRHHT